MRRRFARLHAALQGAPQGEHAGQPLNRLGRLGHGLGGEWHGDVSRQSKLRRGLAGPQHCLRHQVPAFQGRQRLQADSAVFHLNLQLRQFDEHRVLGTPPGLRQLSQTHQILERRVLKASFHVSVSQPRDTHPTRHDFGLHDAAVGVHLQAERQRRRYLLQSQPQRVGGRGRQHRNGALRQVEIAAAGARFQVHVAVRRR